MSEQELAALQGAAEDVAVSDQSETLEATENTEGQGDQPAPVEETEEQKTKSKARRDRRDAADRRARDEVQQSEHRARDAESRLAKLKAYYGAVVEPKEDDYKDAFEYVAAKAAWQSTQASTRYQEHEISGEIEAHKQARQMADQMRMDERATDFRESLPDARARYADFDAVLAVAQRGDVVSHQLSQMILESDSPHDLAYALGRDPDKARALSQMSPTQAARELGRMEARLSLPRAKTQSTAPDPITPIRGSARPIIDPSKMSNEEYRAKRKSGEI